MSHINLIIILSVTAILLLCFLMYFAVKYISLKKYSKTLSSSDIDEFRISARKRYDTLKGVYHLLYLTCDNFPKHKNRISEYIIQSYSDKSLFTLSNDIIDVTNICERGSITSIAEEYSLTPTELRTCCFLYWGFKWQQTCLVENLTENAYNVRCSRIRKKFNLKREDTISGFVYDYCKKRTNLSVQ